MAIINRDTDLVYACKYQVSALAFMKGDENLIMDASNILSIEKLDDYEFNLRSILKVNVRLDVRKKKWIMKNKRDIKCKFELDIFGIDTDSETEVMYPYNIFNAHFGIYLNDEDEATDTETLEETIDSYEGSDFKSADVDEEGYFTGENTLDVYLFDQDLTNASNNTYNRVFNKGNMQSMIAELLSSSKHKRVLMSPIENTETYYEMLVPPEKAYEGLEYLDQYYGFYKRGTIIYYDTDILYIINPNGKCTAKRKNEYPETTFLISSHANSTPGNGMVQKPKEKVNYVNIPEDNVSPQKPSLSKNAKYGSSARIIVSDSLEIDTINADQSYMNQRNESIKYIKKDDNKFLAAMTKARMEENECILYISGDNFDISAFTPNKTYRVVFEETSKQQKYGKYLYRIAYAYHFIKAESIDRMTSSHQIILKRACSDVSVSSTT